VVDGEVTTAVVEVDGVVSPLPSRLTIKAMVMRPTGTTTPAVSNAEMSIHLRTITLPSSKRGARFS
jgi:hypothetical protein